jgi:hypothetical protein
MRAKFALLPVAFLLILVGVVTGLTQNSRRAHPGRGQGLLKDSASKAKAEGKSEVVVRAPIYRPAAPRSLDQAFRYHTAVIATPVDKTSYVQAPDEIVTWYKFKVAEYLNRQPAVECSACPSPPSPPEGMSPLQEDEILIPRPSGSVEIDGVRVISVESGFPPFMRSKKYLLFVQFDSSGRVGMLRMGAYGVFDVDENGAIRHINNTDHPFKREIETPGGVGNDIERLKAKVRELQK